MIKKVTRRKSIKKPRKKKISPKKDPIRHLAEVLYNAAEDGKAKNIFVFDLRNISSFTDYILICSGTSDRHAKAVAGRMEEATLKKLKKKPYGIEGAMLGHWVLLDYGDVVCHVFQEEIRSFYRLEDLWYGAKKVKFRKRVRKK